MSAETLVKRPAGQEALHDYPGPRGLLAQLNAGLTVTEARAKLRKAIRQGKEQFFGLKPILVERQRALKEIEDEVENARRLIGTLERYLKKLG